MTRLVAAGTGCPGRPLVVAVAAHLALSAVHGGVHVGVPVPVPAWQYAYAGVVILLAPLVGLALAGAGRPRLGAAVALASGVGSLAFEGPLHFLVHNPDHVSTVGRGRTAFAATAALSTLGDVLLVVAAAWILRPAPGNGASG